jgi:hypothetical protein
LVSVFAKLGKLLLGHRPLKGAQWSSVEADRLNALYGDPKTRGANFLY